MTLIDTDTKHKLREMGVGALADSFEMQDDVITVGMPFAERLKLAVDDAHASFTGQKITGLIRRAALRYPDAERRRLDLYYVQNWSIWLDINVLLKTLLVIFKG